MLWRDYAYTKVLMSLRCSLLRSTSSYRMPAQRGKDRLGMWLTLRPGSTHIAGQPVSYNGDIKYQTCNCELCRQRIYCSFLSVCEIPLCAYGERDFFALIVN